MRCQAQEISCVDDPTACPEGWTCIDNPNGVCWASTDGTSGCTTDGPEKICAPPYYEQAQALAGQSTGGEWALYGPFDETANGTDGTRSVVDSPSDTNATPEEGGSTGRSSSEGGCNLAPTGAAGGAWLLALLALVGFIRRRS
jgi:MYXO-CTERM domain-containing protein